MSHKTEYIWTCKIGGPAIQFQSGADAPMRQAVQAAFKQVTGNDEAFCFSGWGGELTEPERAVVENRLPNTERAAVQAAQPESVGLFDRAKAVGDEALRLVNLLASAPTPEPMSAPTEAKPAQQDAVDAEQKVTIAKAASFDWLLSDCVVEDENGWLRVVFETSRQREHLPDRAKWIAKDIAWEIGVDLEELTDAAISAKKGQL